MPRTTGEQIRTRFACEAVVAAAARDVVVTLLAEERLALGAAHQRVVPRPTGERGRVRAGFERVVPGPALDAPERAEHVVALAGRAVVREPVQANGHVRRVIRVGDAASRRQPRVQQVGTGAAKKLGRGPGNDDVVVTRPSVH